MLLSVACGCVDKEKSVGCRIARGASSNYTSCQMRILSPLPIFDLQLDPNQLDASFPSQIKTKVKPPNRGGIFHIFIYKSLQPPYLEYRILIHRASCWYKTFYLYCPSRVSLKYVIFAIPNSPWSFGLHIFLQLTSFDISLIQFSHSQRKFLWNLSIFFSTFKGPLKKDI